MAKGGRGDAVQPNLYEPTDTEVSVTEPVSRDAEQEEPSVGNRGSVG